MDVLHHLSKKQKTPYLGFIHGHKLKHKQLLSEARKQIKVYYLDPEKDIDIKTLRELVMEAVLYVDGLTLKR